MRSAAPWICIILLTGAFHFIRGAPLDGVLFMVAGVALLADAVGLLGHPVTSLRLTPRVALVVGLIAGTVLVVSPLYGTADVMTITALGLLVVPVAWPQSLDDLRVPTADQQAAAVRHAGILWSLVGVVGCLWELSSYFLGVPSVAAAYAHPPLSDLVGPLTDSVPGRVVCVAVWLIGGYALLRRGRAER